MVASNTTALPPDELNAPRRARPSATGVAVGEGIRTPRIQRAPFPYRMRQSRKALVRSIQKLRLERQASSLQPLA
jgi:hypothetical protein